MFILVSPAFGLDDKTWIYVGAIAGGVVLLCVIAIIVVCICRRSGSAYDDASLRKDYEVSSLAKPDSVGASARRRALRAALTRRRRRRPRLVRRHCGVRRSARRRRRERTGRHRDARRDGAFCAPARVDERSTRRARARAQSYSLVPVNESKAAELEEQQPEF